TRVPLIGTFFQLKHLMPLRLGVNIRNVISPKLGYGGKADKYPTALRVGASYRLPSDWLLQNSGVLLVSDYEWLFDDMDRLIRLSRRVSFSKIAPGAGQYFGTEFQYQTEKLKLSPRFGLSHVYNDWKFSTGFGVAFEASGMDFQFDFAHGYHENLADDQRISLTIRFGGKRDADYFVDPWQIRPIVSPDTMWSIDPCEPPVEPLADESDESADTVTSPGTNLSRRSTALRVVSGFPDLWEEALPAAVTLARELDTANADRYLELVGGPLLAVNLAERAIGTFQIDRRGEASRVALEAIARFEELVAESPDIMGDYFNVLLGQCEMINAATVEGAAANGAWSRAADLLYRALDNVQCLKLHFLIGTCHQKEKDFTRAAEQFQKGLETSDADSQSMRTLSRLLLGEALLNSNHADSAIAVLSKLTQSQTLPMASLSADYPRYWTFDDMRVPDDAQYFIARCYLSLNDDSRAAAEFVKICRFYPGSDKCEEAAVETNQAVQKLLNR
ncbi:MAG: tetratricopeptide repeat protein, partial [candidate division Zixibacteria bacterium]|nr:tetratricopeptide repeat protein [candidate division Zixibacteria bacterium]